MRFPDGIAEDTLYPIGRVLMPIAPAAAAQTTLDLSLDYSENLVLVRNIQKEGKKIADQALELSD